MTLSFYSARELGELISKFKRAIMLYTVEIRQRG